MPTVTGADLARMREQLFFDGPNAGRKLSRFWLLLSLAGVIAAAGVAADSTATVIGAMIVAPLMTPILGIVLSITENDRLNLLRSVGLVVGGAALVIAIGWLLGVVSPVEVVAQNNSQVASRVSPKLIDLLAAVATGAVGAVSLVRSDISDTLPGVAIAISLVPPLAVVGFTLQAGAGSQAWGAFLLFATNVSAILATGVAVMILYGVFAMRGPAHAIVTRPGVVVVAILVLAVAAPLTVTSIRVGTTTSTQSTVNAVAGKWAHAAGWSVVSTDAGADGIVVRVIGPQPAPDPAQLRTMLDDRGLRSATVQVQLIPERRVTLAPAGG